MALADSEDLTPGLIRREAVGFVPLVLPERSGGKGHRLSPAFPLSEAKGEPVII